MKEDYTIAKLYLYSHCFEYIYSILRIYCNIQSEMKDNSQYALRKKHNNKAPRLC